MIKVYGNAAALQTMDWMCKSGRLAHSFLLYGETGLGKKTLAAYLAQRLVCEDAAHAPCGVCRACRNAEAMQHPDICAVEHSGKNMGFSVETIRKLCTDAHIIPNNGARKIYLLTDADRITVQAQNALLKLIEEPPEFAYFIFTARARQTFLDTILSRVVSLGVTACDPDTCRRALADRGYTQEQIASALEAFCGNIGMCIAFLEDPSLQHVVALTKTLSSGIMNRDEYTILTALTACAAEKTSLHTVLDLLDRQVRDALVLRDENAAQIGCDPAGARALGTRLSLSRAEQIHKAIAHACADLESNVAPVLTVTALCAEIMK